MLAQIPPLPADRLYPRSGRCSTSSPPRCRSAGRSGDMSVTLDNAASCEPPGRMTNGRAGYSVNRTSKMMLTTVKSGPRFPKGGSRYCEPRRPRRQDLRLGRHAGDSSRPRYSRASRSHLAR